MEQQGGRHQSGGQPAYISGSLGHGIHLPIATLPEISEAMMAKW
jgi:hypothetical protein